MTDEKRWRGAMGSRRRSACEQAGAVGALWRSRWSARREGHHRFGDRDAADGDARVVPAFGRDLRVLATDANSRLRGEGQNSSA